MKSFISFLIDAYMENTPCNCESCTEQRDVTEGSARGAEQRRGVYAKSREIHLQDVLSREKLRGVDANNPHTDARKYARIHTQPYNVGKTHSAGK
jgi:hypothetical protein